MFISSYKNNKIKDLRSLYKKKYQNKKGQIVLEGVRIIEDALAEGAKIKRVFYIKDLLEKNRTAKLIKQLKAENIELIAITEEICDRVSDVENSQGILAVVKRPEYELNDLLNQKEGSFLLIIDRLQDPGNLGTIIRTADAAGIDGIIMTKGTVNLYNQKVIRATMGSLFRIPAVSVDKLNQLKAFLTKQEVKLFATSLKGEKNYFAADYSGNVALIVGNEAHGVRDELITLADETIKIPLRGGAESLNAAIATAIVTYEGVKQRIDD